MKIGIVGPGRAGTGLGLALHGVGHAVQLHGRTQREVPYPLDASFGGPPPWLDEVEVILLAVQDRKVETAAQDLLDAGGVDEDHVVLHLSGLLDRAPLECLMPTGASLGTFHPLQAIAIPKAAPQRFRGALAVLTGDERATSVSHEIAQTLGMVPVVINREVKAKYHAAAVIASNFTVVLAAVAEQLFLDCGFDEETARKGLARLMEGTLENVAEMGPQAALTGPVVRGDEETLNKHRQVLPKRLLEMYRAVGAVARQVGQG